MMFSNESVGWQIRVAGMMEARIPTLYDLLGCVMITLIVPNPQMYVARSRGGESNLKARTR